MDSDRYIKAAERVDGLWDWHMMSRRGNLPDEETFSSRQGFTSAHDAARAALHEMEVIQAHPDRMEIIVQVLSSLELPIDLSP